MWPRRAPKHEHQLRVASYDIPPPSMGSALGMTSIPPRVTHVLLRCECGEGPGHLVSIPLGGHFVLGALLGLEIPPMAIPAPDPGEAIVPGPQRPAAEQDPAST